MNRLSFEKSCDRSVRKVTWNGLVVNVFLAVFKITAGMTGHSRALVADGVHSVSDLASDLMILIGARYWSQPPDARHPHGHRRMETLIAFGIGILLVATALGMLVNAGKNLMTQAPRPGGITIVAAAVSLFSKELLYRYTIRSGRRYRSLALEANAWHHRTDALSSVPVLLAIITVRVKPEWFFLDAIAAIAVVFFIIHAGYRIVTPSIQKLIDAGAPPETIDRIRKTAEKTPGVMDAHDIRTRYISDTKLAVDLHILVDGAITVREGHAISHEARNNLYQEFPDVSDVVVHIEPND